MKVCIVIPPRVDGKWIGREDKHSAASEDETMPYTAPLIYALIRESHPSMDVEIVEAQRDGLSYEDVEKRLDEAKPDIVISFLSWTHIPWDRRCAELPYPTIAVILQQYIDQREAVEIYNLRSSYFVKQEIEMPIVDALGEFAEAGAIRRTPGFIVRTAAGLEDTGKAEMADIARFPTPDFGAFQPDKYYALREKNVHVPRSLVRIAHFNTMKGCLYKCAYCGQANKGQGIRYQTVQQVMDQIEYFVLNHAVRKFIFFDNEFAINMNRAKQICREIIKKDYAISYSINNRIELFDDELIQLLAQSGCSRISLGIETCDPVLQEYINKKIDLNRAKRVIRKLKSANIGVHLYMTPGIPGETRKSLRMNARFVAEVDADTASSGPLFIMPNSPIYRKLRSEGKLLERDWTEYRSFNKLCYINESYKTIAQVKRAERYMKRRIYYYKIAKRAAQKRIDYTSIARLLLTVSSIRKAYLYIPNSFKQRVRDIVGMKRLDS